MQPFNIGRMPLTRQSAWQAGVAEANEQMRAAGRDQWADEDHELAVEVQLRLMRAGGLLDELYFPTPLFFQGHPAPTVSA